MEIRKIKTKHSADDAWILTELERHGKGHFSFSELAIDLMVCLFRRLERLEQKLDELLEHQK